MPAGQPRPYLVNLWPNFANDLNMLKTMIWGALLVATSLLNTYINFLLKLDKNWLSYEQNTICPYLDIRTKLRNLAAKFFKDLNQKSAFYNKGFFLF